MQKIGKILEIIKGLEEAYEAISKIISLYHTDKEFGKIINEKLDSETRKNFFKADSAISKAHTLIEEKLNNIEIEF